MANTLNAKLNQDRAAKKAYHRPNFVSYGNIREITQAVDTVGMMDSGGSTGMDKT
jgi:hypothetical protein